MNPTEILRANFDSALLKEYFFGIKIVQNIPLATSTRDTYIPKSNIDKIINTFEGNNYIVEQVGNYIFSFTPKSREFKTIYIDFREAFAFTALIEDGIPIIIVICKDGSRLMAYRQNLETFKFLEPDYKISQADEQ